MFRSLPENNSVFFMSDLHGDYDAFELALAAAPANALIVLLGDVVDRGPYSPFCAERLLELIDSERALLVPGNHDTALVDVIDGSRGATPRRAETLQQFEDYGGDLLARFCELVRHSALCLRIGDLVAVHAAWSADMETVEQWPDTLRQLALRGEREKVPGRRRPITKYHWTTRVPANKTILVGHDVRSTEEPVVCESKAGGRAVFLDLGCGKGGALGCAHYEAGALSFSAVPSDATATGRDQDDDI
jgi:protein phosphatase